MMVLWQLWWAWVVFGALLAALEIVLPGFVFLGFAVGAALTGIAIWLGLLAGLGWMLLWFALLSLAAWVVFRRSMGVRRGQMKLWDRDINDN